MLRFAHFIVFFTQEGWEQGPESFSQWLGFWGAPAGSVPLGWKSQPELGACALCLAARLCAAAPGGHEGSPSFCLLLALNWAARKCLGVLLLGIERVLTDGTSFSPQ